LLLIVSCSGTGNRGGGTDGEELNKNDVVAMLATRCSSSFGEPIEFGWTTSGGVHNKNELTGPACYVS
jgi:hypothetical protein